MMELNASAICVAIHPALEKDCPVCGAKISECCIEDAEELPVYAVHIGRETGGADLMVEPTGTYDGEGNAILREVEN